MPDSQPTIIGLTDEAAIAWDRRDRLIQIAIWSSLIISIVFVYAQAAAFDFINLDDNQYVFQNPHVLEGLSFGSIKWAFTSETVGNWVPLTMLSHMVTSQFFGMTAGMHHVVNILLHLLASGFLFAFLQRATARALESGFVALMFALHPMHVESVAWVSERKDVLSAVFFFGILYVYVRYTENLSALRYCLVMVLFAFGLMAKPILVTVPFLLLVIDWWPLQRLNSSRNIWEKLPLLLLSIAQSAVTYWIQTASGSVQLLPLQTRISNALVSYVIYIQKTFWPSGLAVFYPYPDSIAAWKVWTSVAFLGAVCGLVILVRRKRPYYAAGWFWYLGMMVLVIGFIQAGFQSRADRYTYLPMVGLTVMLAWGGADLVKRWPSLRPVVLSAAGLAVLLSSAFAWRQATFWQNSETLYTHTLEVTENNWLAHSNLAEHLTLTSNRRGEAIVHLETAIRIKPNYPSAHNNLGVYLAQAELCASAIPHFEITLRELPNDVGANSNLGLCLMKAGRYD